MDKTKMKTSSNINRHFSEEFKRVKVKELEENQITVAKLVFLYGVSRTSVYRWMYKYSNHYKKGTKLVVEMESESHKTERLLRTVSELERIIGQKQLEIDYLNKLIEVASEELEVDLKKNFITKLWNGSGPTKENTPGQ